MENFVQIGLIWPVDVGMNMNEVVQVVRPNAVAVIQDDCDAGVANDVLNVLSLFAKFHHVRHASLPP